MSTEINETRMDQDPEHEQAEQSWSDTEAGAEQEQPLVTDFDSERGEEVREDDETGYGESRFGRDESAPAPAYLTAEDVEAEQPVQGAGSVETTESEQDQEAIADPDEFPAFGEPAIAAPPVSDDLPSDEADLEPSTDAGYLGSSEATASPEGVARPEDLGARGTGTGAEPLIGADAQREFLDRWTKIQMTFIEDPSGAVRSADTLVQEIGAAIAASLQDRSGELSTGANAAADTEQQRLALREYRAYIGVLLPQ